MDYKLSLCLNCRHSLRCSQKDNVEQIQKSINELNINDDLVGIILTCNYYTVLSQARFDAVFGSNGIIMNRTERR